MYIRWFKDITIKDVPIVGGKNASLGEMYNRFAKIKNQKSKIKINVPNGFAITAKAYFDFLKKGKIQKEIEINETNNERLKKEIPGLKFTSHTQAIKILYSWYKNNMAMIDKKRILNDPYINNIIVNS